MQLYIESFAVFGLLAAFRGTRDYSGCSFRGSFKIGILKRCTRKCPCPHWKPSGARRGTIPCRVTGATN